MQSTQDMLFDEIRGLPVEKVGKAISFIRYLKQEPEPLLWLDPAEDDELNALYASGDTVDASEVAIKITAMPND